MSQASDPKKSTGKKLSFNRKPFLRQCIVGLNSAPIKWWWRTPLNLNLPLKMDHITNLLNTALHASRVTWQHPSALKQSSCKNTQLQVVQLRELQTNWLFHVVTTNISAQGQRVIATVTMQGYVYDQRTNDRGSKASKEKKNTAKTSEEWIPRIKQMSNIKTAIKYLNLTTIYLSRQFIQRL